MITIVKLKGQIITSYIFLSLEVSFANTKCLIELF